MDSRFYIQLHYVVQAFHCKPDFLVSDSVSLIFSLHLSESKKTIVYLIIIFISFPIILKNNDFINTRYVELIKISKNLIHVAAPEPLNTPNSTISPGKLKVF